MVAAVLPATGVVTRTGPGPGGALTQATDVIATMRVNGAGEEVGSSAAPEAATTPGGLQTVGSTTIVRPANTTAYTAGDLVADNVTAANVTNFVFANAVRSAAECFRIERCRLRKSTALLTNASFRVYLFRAAQAVNVGDNGVLNNVGVLAMANVDNLVGWFDIVMDRAGVAGARGVGVPAVGPCIITQPAAGTSLYALVEVLGPYVPGSAETFAITLEGEWA